MSLSVMYVRLCQLQSQDLVSTSLRLVFTDCSSLLIRTPTKLIACCNVKGAEGEFCVFADCVLTGVLVGIGCPGALLLFAASLPYRLWTFLQRSGSLSCWSSSLRKIKLNSGEHSLRKT